MKIDYIMKHKSYDISIPASLGRLYHTQKTHDSQNSLYLYYNKET